ncbi:MAG TPA: flavodoxin family protein [Methanospirillum sp.]|nr:flavodoxin family protein [Methanospirillum sp.]
MKVIGFVGSPRTGGNTATLVARALEGAKASGAETELISLPSLTISGCQGCKYCKTHETCRINDDMQDLYKKIREADAIIFGTPVYFAQMSGQMKIFIDRLYALIDSEYMPLIAPGKKAAVILAQGDENADTFIRINETFSFAMSFLGVSMSSPLIVPGLDAPKDAEKIPSAMERAFVLGKDLAV